MAGLDRKYVVFKADEWDRTATMYPQINTVTPDAIDDAIVLRKQDVFTSSALYEYGGVIRTAIEVIESILRSGKDPGAELARMKELADMFTEEAIDAETRNDRKVPD